MKLIVGLGNPGERYEHTRHNIGFLIVDRLAERWGIRWSPTKLKGWVGEGSFSGEKVVLLKPMTYMNLSGESVRPVKDWYKVDLDQIAVIYDDLDLPTGQLRLREKGSAGGHNGMKSIIQHLGTQEFKRIRVGVDRPSPGDDIARYVLEPFPKAQQTLVEESIDRSCQAVESWIKESFFKAMNQFHK
jgi:PTH1 family peptidyl-tRNA hydrolase